jgi:hypothetical protein
MPLYQYRKGEQERTLLFIHVPKTGGTAIETFFRGIGFTGYFDPPTYMPVRNYLKVPPAHYDYGALKKLFNLDGLYSFAVVRHPVQRMISEYKWGVEKATDAAKLSHMDFGQYLRLRLEQYGRDENLAAGHFKPQVRFVGDKVSKIFKYESGLESIVKHVLRDIGLNHEGMPPLPTVNNSPSRTVVPSDSDLALIAKVYAEDFDAFGYSLQTSDNGARA